MEGLIGNMAVMEKHHEISLAELTGVTAEPRQNCDASERLCGVPGSAASAALALSMVRGDVAPGRG